MTLRARLAFGLVLIAAVLVVPLLVARRSMHSLQADVRDLRDTEFRASLSLGRLRDALADVRSREVALSVVKSDTVYDQLHAALDHASSLTDSLERYDLKHATASIHRALAVIDPATQREFALARAGRSDPADSISQTVVHPALHEAELAISSAEQDLRGRTSERVTSAEEKLADGERYSLAALAVALLLATAIALWLTRSVSQPIQALDEGMRAVADGDLDHKLDYDVHRKDEFGRLATSFADMSRQLADLDKLKAEFVSIASHELKTPINVILGYLSLMQEGMYGPMDQRQFPVVETIETQARTLARLANQLLDVSRFEAGGGRIDPRPLKLHTMLDELERTFHVLAVQREVAFTVTRNENLPDDVVWDAERINEVTGNLLSNAFKFTNAGGKVELIAGPDENGVCIEVSDTGAGIPPDQLPHIFEKFYQADNQRAASAKGSGLGLAIAKEIVEAHQGHITCSSALGKGTRFTIILPITVVKGRRTGGFRVVSQEERA